MAIVISGVNNNDKITASDGTIDLLSGVNFVSEITVPSFKVGSGIQLGNAGVATATTFVGNLTGNVNATSNLLLQIGGSEKFRIASDGDVIIGGSSDAGYANYADNLTIHGTGNEGITIRSGTTSQGAIYFSDATGTGTGTYEGSVIYDHNENNLRFATNHSEKLRIDSSGRVLIGTTTAGESSADELTVANSGHAGMTIRSGTSSWGSFFFSDGTSGGAQYDGAIEYKHSDNYMRFRTAQTERLRITSDGKIGINQISPGTGLHINQDWVASYGSISAEGGNNALVGLGLRSSGTYRAALIWRDGTSGDYLELATQASSKPILFKPNNTERVRIQDGGLKLNGGSYIMDVSAGHGAPNNNNKQMDQRRWMWYGASSSTHTVARVAKAAGGQPGDGDSQLAAFIVTYTARTMYSFNSSGGYSVMKMRTGRFNYNNDTVHFSTEQDTLGTGSGSQNPTIVFTDEGSGVVRISITNPSSTHSFGEINLMTYDCRITLPTG